MIDNYNALSGLVIGVLTFTVICYAVVLQSLELSRPKDPVSKLRKQIFFVLLIALITSAPSLMYLYFRTIGVPDPELVLLRNVSTIAARIGGLANAVIIVMMFRFTIKKGD